MQQAERHAREAGVRERALTLDDHVVGGLRGLAHHLFRGTGDEVSSDGVDRDPLTGDRDARLTRGYEGGAFPEPAQRADDLERRGHLPHRRVGAHGEHDDRAGATLPMATDRKISRRLAKFAHRRAPALRRRGKRGIREHALVQTVPHGDPALERASKVWPIGIRDATAGRGGPDEQRLGAERERLIDGRDDRHSFSDTDMRRRIRARARRVDDRDHGVRRVAQHADRCLRGRARELSFREDRELHGPPRSAPSRRNRPARSPVVSPISTATAPFTTT